MTTSRIPLALNVADLDKALVFYSKLFATEPAKVRPECANLAVVDAALKLVLIKDAGQIPGIFNHLGFEDFTAGEVVVAQVRLAGEGLATAMQEQGADVVLLRSAGQGVGQRPGRRAMGDLHDSVPYGDARWPPSVGCSGRRCVLWHPALIWQGRPRQVVRVAERSTKLDRRPPVSDVAAPPKAEVPLETPVIDRLSFLDRFLPVWIILAMAVGLGLGRAIPSLNRHLNAIQVTSGTSLPIFIGLLVMMYPVLAKVRYDQLGSVTRDRRMLVSSLVLNWVIGPAVMFTLAWLLLPDLPTYRTGLIIVGLARCIAMVLIWNELSCGDREAAAVVVALNSLFQIVAFALLGYFYLRVLPGWLGLSQQNLHVSVWGMAKSVLVFLGVPLAAGYLTRRIGEARRGRAWYEGTFLPKIGPVALSGLLFPIVVLFALQGHTITSHPADVARIALPLLAYFAIMWFGTFAYGRAIGLPYDRTATLAFTAAGNNFELAIAVAIGVFGVTSGEALAGVVGPLIEVPVLVGLVYVSLWARRRYPSKSNQPTLEGAQ